MKEKQTRRDFLQASGAVAGTTLLLAPFAAPAAGPRAAGKPIRVVVWDEQQPEQKEAYDNFLGNWIAKYLEARPGLAVKSVNLGEPQQGLSAAVLDHCDVLLWWGHKRQGEVTPETGKALVERIKDGALALVALHSAHCSTPFMEAMNERTRADVAKTARNGGSEKVEITYVDPPRRYTLPAAASRVTPYVVERKFPTAATQLSVHLPFCCFPEYRTDGKPSQLRVLKPDHPIAQGLPRQFELPHTEMYNEPFHVPEPDEVVLEERWAGGEWFRSGAVWKVGKGKVFYFRPGHETFAVYKEKPVLQILENAVRWLAT